MRYVRNFLVLTLFLAWTAAAPAQRAVSKDNLRSGPKVVQAFRDVVADPSRSVARVLRDGKEVALAAVVDADGLFVTKAGVLAGIRDDGKDSHIAKDGWVDPAAIIPKGKLVCKMRDGKEFAAKIVGIQEPHDLAFLQVDAKGLTPVAWRDSEQAAVGKWVVSVGPSPDPVAIGIVSVATRGFKFGDQPSKNLDRNAGWLGIGLAEDSGGAKITGVFPGGPAQKAGLKADDLVQEAAGKKIIDTESLINKIQSLRAGDNVVIKVKRGNETQEFKVTLGKRPKELFGNPQESFGNKLSERRGGFPKILQHDTVLQPTDCGGPLVDLDGKTVGINIARAGRVETYAIPAEVVQKLLADPDLRAGKRAPPEPAAKTAPPEKK